MQFGNESRGDAGCGNGYTYRVFRSLAWISTNDKVQSIGRLVLLVGLGCAQAMGGCEAHNPSPGPFPKGRGDPFCFRFGLDKLCVESKNFTRRISPSLWEGAGGWVSGPKAHRLLSHGTLLLKEAPLRLNPKKGRATARPYHSLFTIPQSPPSSSYHPDESDQSHPTLLPRGRNTYGCGRGERCCCASGK